jgi:hypothetical protein
MADNTIKTIKVNAPTSPVMVDEEAPLVGGRRRRRTKKIGGAQVTGVNTQAAPVPADKGLVQILKVTDTGATMNPAIVQKAGTPLQAGGDKTNVPPGPELGTNGAKPVAAPVPTATQSAGSIKVVLKPKANKRTKVLLKKKQAAQPVIVSKKKAGRPASSTRKLVVKSLSNKLKRTRHTIKQAKSLPLEQIKKILIEKKLIKPTSKAPESVLRQMYSDTLIVSKKML